MNIQVCVRRIDLKESEIDYTEYGNLYSFISDMENNERAIPDEYLPTVYYTHSKNNAFKYMNNLEKVISVSNRDLYWDWDGVRKGNEYYLELNITTLADSLEKIENALSSAFPHPLKYTDSFDMPDIDNPVSFDNDNELGEDDTDDVDSVLRELEVITIGNPFVQWERRPAEDNSSPGVSALIGIAAGTGSFAHAFLKDFLTLMRKNHYARRIEALRKKVVKKCGNKGHFVIPSPELPNIFNAAEEEYEYEFVQIMDDGSKSRVFVGVDSGHVHSIQFTE